MDGGALHPFRALEATGGDAGLTSDAINALEAEGFVHTQGQAGGGLPTVWISDTGSAAVRALRERRVDPKLRAIACREALLDWAYAHPGFPGVEDFHGDVRAHYEGDPFSEEEVSTAAADLRTMDYVEGAGVAESSAPVRIKIKGDGKKVVESFGGSIRAYENRGQMQGGNHYTFTGNEVSGVIVAGVGNQVTQANQTSHPELADLIKAVVDAARGTEIEDRIGKLMAQLELEIDEEEPDETIVGKTLDRAQDVARKAGVDIVVQLVMRAAQYIHDHGIAQLAGLG